MATHAKRLALLLFLARGGQGLIRRDVLLGLFWPDSDQAHGRGALRQALSGLRRQLGASAILAQGEEEVGLAPELVSCDATEFERAAGAGRHDDACRFYLGDFAAGFQLGGPSPDFDQWVDGERVRLRHAAIRSFQAAAEQAEREGRPSDAASLLRRISQLAPDDEASVARLIALLDRMGERSSALAAYQIFENHLAEEFAAAPSPETLALISAVRTRSDPRQTTAPRESAPPRPSGGGHPGSAMSSGAGHSPSMRSPRRLVPAGAIGALVTAAGIAALAWVRQPVGSAPTQLAVARFNVESTDSTYRWLGDGMVDLLTIRFSGVKGLEVAEPGHSTAAGRVVQGSVNSTSSGLVLTAWIENRPGKRTLARASVSGPEDSLQTLIDRLAIQLIGQVVGIEVDRLAPSTSASIPAIRAFVAGRAAFRSGRMEDAFQHFLTAVEADSDFAIAALDLYRTTRWLNKAETGAIGERRAVAGRNRLPPADRALLDAMRGQGINAASMFDSWNMVTTVYPDRPESWYGLGHAYHHWGLLAGIEGSLERAEAAFRRGWQLDSMAESRSALATGAPLVAEPVLHMVELAHMRGDTLEVRRLVDRVVAADSTTDLAHTVRWHRAVMDGASARRAFWNGIGPASQRSTMWILLFITWSGVGAEDYSRATAEDLKRLRMQDPGYTWFANRVIALNSGRPSRVPAPDNGLGSHQRPAIRASLRDAMWSEGDSASAVESARRLAHAVSLPVRNSKAVREQNQDLCVLGEWEAQRGDLKAAEAASRRLHAAGLPALEGQDSASFAQFTSLCAALLDAAIASARGSTSVALAIARADSMARNSIFEVCCSEAVPDANLLLARLWERSGDRPRALRAVRRRAGGFGVGPIYLSTFLREEGRLAALTGDTAAAIKAYRHYLMLRPDPEPSLRPAVERVRRELDILVSNWQPPSSLRR